MCIVKSNSDTENSGKPQLHSSTSSDNIRNRCFKNCSELFVQHLINLYSLVRKQGYIPAMWKTANIILLLKPKKDKPHSRTSRH